MNAYVFHEELANQPPPQYPPVSSDQTETRPLMDLVQPLSFKTHEFGKKIPLDNTPSLSVDMLRDYHVNATLSVIGWIFISFWFFVSLIIFVSKGIAYIRFRKQLETWREITDGFVYQQFLQCIKLTGLSFVPTLRVAPEERTIPFALGIRKKSSTVIISQSMARMRHTKKLRIMLCHELLHVKKNDSIVNLLRFIGLVFLHYHPVRILADRFVEGFQEITTDLNTIKTMNLTKKEYVSLLLAKFMEMDKQYDTQFMAAPFLDGEVSFVKRMFFIKRFNPNQTAWSKLLSYSLFLFFILAIFFNLSIYASLPNIESLNIGEQYSQYPFPQPQKTFPSIVHYSDGQTQIHNGLLWVLEPQYGIFAYQFDEQQGPRLVASHTFETVGQGSEQIEIAIDFAFYGNYIYLAVSESNYQGNGPGRLEILHFNENDRSIQVVQTMKGEKATCIEIVNQSLWIASKYLEDSSSNPQGVLTIYDLTDPHNPDQIDYEYYDATPSVIVPIDNGNQILVVLEFELMFYDDETSLNPSNSIYLTSSPGNITQLDNNRLVVQGFSLNPVGFGLGGNLTAYLILLKKNDAGRFALEKTVQIQVEPAMNQPFYQSTVAFNTPDFSSMFFNFPLNFSGTLEYQDDRLCFAAYSKNPYSFAFKWNDKLVCLYPETAIFDTNNFQPSQSEIIAWDSVQ